MSTVIEDVIARKIFNSRGEETIEVDVITAGGFGRASAPSGASRGKAEATPYPKGGIEEAIRKVEQVIAPEIIGLNADNQGEIDSLLHSLDGTENFNNIGGNTAFAVSLAVADAAANTYGLPLFQYLGGFYAKVLPYPLGNVLSGGKHTAGKGPEIQEFLSLPLGAPSFLEAQRANATVHEKVRRLLEKKDKTFTGGKSDEGAWTCSLSNDEALEIVYEACEETSKELGFECQVGLDVAASTFWNARKKRYVYKDKALDSNEQLDYILELINNYKLAYVEDPFHEEDFEKFAELTKKAKNCLICGDDLFVTNLKRLQKGIKLGAANTIIIKVNQIGTLTDAWETIRTAKAASYTPVISHRSGDTVDSHIAHLAVGFNCPIIKTGVVEGARIAKLNELIRIEEMLADRALMAQLKV
ncbi:phosphopyruvate hydratase [Candidatus Bathyarchaeota archaeon]|nr:phosphopyruvate hydratase [Candidatus Bathyarchaeota archaeon]